VGEGRELVFLRKQGFYMSGVAVNNNIEPPVIGGQFVKPFQGFVFGSMRIPGVAPRFARLTPGCPVQPRWGCCIRCSVIVRY